MLSILAAALREDPSLSCVAGKNGTIHYRRSGSGIDPLWQLTREADLRGYAVADKVVGKAAAVLLCKAGVKAVYGEIVSQSALEFMQLRNILVEYTQLVPYIANRTGSDKCPMEACVWNAQTLEEGYTQLMAFLQARASRQGGGGGGQPPSK